MPEIGTSGLMSGEGKRGVGHGPSYRAYPRLYSLIRATGPSLRSTHPTKTRFRDLAARCVRGLLSTSRPLDQRAQGRPGACCTRGLACDLRKQNCTRAYRAAGAFRPSLRNGFTAYFVLFPENGSFASVACELASRTLNASTAAPEPHDFAVRFRPRTSSRSPQRPSHLTARS